MTNREFQKDVRTTILGEAKKFEDWHKLPADTGIYAIQIVETGELYVGATMKQPRIVGGNIIKKFGIYDRITHHLTGYPVWSHSKISETMYRVYKGELHAVYYVLGLTTSERYAKELETRYIQLLEPELNTQKNSNLSTTSTSFTDTEKDYIAIEEFEPVGIMALPQTRYVIKKHPKARQVKISI